MGVTAFLAVFPKTFVMARVDVYEVDPWRRGRYDEEHARFVAAGDADEAAYKLAGEYLHTKATAGSFGCASGGLGMEAPRRSCFTPPESLTEKEVSDFGRL
jgi:hypothetical protein